MSKELNIGRSLITLELSDGAEFEDRANELINQGYRMGAMDISLNRRRYAAIFELPTKAKHAEKRIGDLQTRLQQMFAVLKDYRDQEIPAEDAIAVLDQRIHSAFKALCGVEK